MASKAWTPDELYYLKNHYGKVPNTILIKHLNRSYASIQHKAQREGLTEPSTTTRQPWTEKEIKILERNYERTGAEKLAKRLKRSVRSVRKKAQALGLNAYINDNLYLRTLADCFQCDPSVIHRWIRNGLPARQIQRGNLTLYQIQTSDFWQWAEQHQSQIPFQKYIHQSLLPEPEWVHNILRNSKVTKHRKPITKSEINYVLYARSQGRSFKDIAKNLQRTEDSIKHIWRDHKNQA